MVRFSSIERDITPRYSFDISGYGVSRGKSNGVLDPIIVSTNLLEIYDKKVVVVAVDFTIVTKNFTDEIRECVSKKYNINKNNISISATHTHSAPSNFYDLNIDEIDTNKVIDRKYLEFVKECIVLSVDECNSKLQEVEVFYSCTNINGYYGNRNIKGNEYDNKFHNLIFKNNNGKIVGCLSNFSCHSTILKTDNMKLSADLVGAIRRRLHEELDCPITLSVGAAGDVSCRYHTKISRYEIVNDFGVGIANQVIKNNQYKKISLENFNVKVAELNIKYDPNKDLNLNVDNYELPVFLNKLLEEKIDEKIKHGMYNINLQTIIYETDDIRLILFPGEIVSGLAKKIYCKSNEKINILICYSNGYYSYFVNEEEYGKYFESINSIFPKGIAEIFFSKINNII